MPRQPPGLWLVSIAHTHWEDVSEVSRMCMPDVVSRPPRGETWCFEHIENNVPIISTSIAAVTTVDRHLHLAYVCRLCPRHPIAQSHVCVNRAIRCQLKSTCSACFTHRCCGTCSCDARLRPSDQSFRFTKSSGCLSGCFHKIRI